MDYSVSQQSQPLVHGCEAIGWLQMAHGQLWSRPTTAIARDRCANPQSTLRCFLASLFVMGLVLPVGPAALVITTRAGRANGRTVSSRTPTCERVRGGLAPDLLGVLAREILREFQSPHAVQGYALSAKLLQHVRSPSFRIFRRMEREVSSLLVRGAVSRARNLRRIRKHEIPRSMLNLDSRLRDH